ncbi:hypothetical protein JCM6294_3037 [Bacteroides pyogenes DSM 20611 = JCM 6294]|uniref:Uncharacterized protein n=1 Tax=Bacteroides pyogenes DSM 20611 = JCM 6294 TaxID=1121100 RepID=W4PKI4_9BACE|nr:hypothetical protein JCM6294_3037 [Bacteroides pyogenes DSM 20611 = JCM 6294]
MASTWDFHVAISFGLWAKVGKSFEKNSFLICLSQAGIYLCMEYSFLQNRFVIRG